MGGFVDSMRVAVDYRLAPTPVPFVGFAAISLGNNNPPGLDRCGMAATGSVWCSPVTMTPFAPLGGVDGPRRPVANLPPLARLVNVNVRTGGCGLTAAGEGYCWSWPRPGMPYTASRVFRTRTLRHLVFGSGVSPCAITTDGKLYC